MDNQSTDSKVISQNKAGGTTITICLNTEDQRFLQRLFSQENIDTIAKQLTQLALEEWLDWLKGVRRYGSETEQTIERVINIYGQILPEEEPDVGFLYNKFNIPYGRARYIIQAIVNRQLSSLNARALQRLIVVLEAEFAELQKMDQTDRKILQEIRFFVDPRAEKLLTTILDHMPLNIRPVSSFRRQPTFLPNTREYSISPRDLENVLKAVKSFYL
jgi:hypothetical protein